MSDLLKSVIEAHGGEQAWSRIETIRATAKIGGLIWAVKGVPQLFDHVIVTANVKEQSVLISSVTNGWSSSFSNDTVTFDRGDGTPTKDLRNARASFHDHVQSTPWDELHAIYFCSYALWTYLTIPIVYSRPGFTSTEVAPWQENGETWRRLQVTYPDDITTHCKTQTSYFGSDGLLRRHDYTVDIMGGAAGANYASDYVEKLGIQFPTQRHVYAYDETGKKIDEPLLVSIQFLDLQ